MLDQQREFRALLDRPYVTRRVSIPSGIEDLVRVVIGPRRACKSVFSAHLAIAENPGCGYVNFDDERLAGITDTDGLLAALDSAYGNPGLILLDEIQNVPNWELWANRLQRQGRRLMLTGSNAHLLSSELATHLTGRHFSIPMLPFSFAEFLEASSKAGAPGTSAEKTEACRSYSRCGGGPEVVLKKMDGAVYLKMLTSAVIHKDIVTRHRLRAPQALDALALCLLSQPGGVYADD